MEFLIFPIGFILFWLMCGILAGVLGSARGGSGCAWFAIGALLGPFGVIIALIYLACAPRR
jgi:hypothetical protein